MKCKRVSRLLSKYLDGETGRNEEKILWHHMEKCPNCREEKDRLECVHQLLMPPRPIEPSPQFLQKVRQRMSGEQGAVFPGPLLFQRFKPALTSLAFLILFAISFLLGSMIGDKVEVPKAKQRQMIVNTVAKTIPLAVFSDIPEGSIVSVYYDLLKE